MRQNQGSAMENEVAKPFEPARPNPIVLAPPDAPTVPFC
jgi:hypothetical protein